MPSFDIVCELNIAEVDNAIQQAGKELAQRYDFKGSDSKVQRVDQTVQLESSDEYKVKAAYDVLQSKLTKRGVSLKSLDPGKVEPAAKGRARQSIALKKGIDKEKAKELVKLIKDRDLKVQASIQDEQVRVTGKKRDDLQEVMAFLRSSDFSLPIQFTNFRE